MGARSVLVLAELTDDERSVLQQDCENCNFEVTWLTSAEMVGPKLVSGKFDTLVVHLQTPGAARACLEARTVLTRVHFPIMGLTDHVDDAVFNKAFRVGVDDVIQLGASAQVSQRLVAIPRPSWKPAGQSRGEALIIDPDRARADALGRLLKEAGYLIKSVRDEAAGRLHLGRQSVRLVVTEGQASTTAELIRRGNRKEWHPIWLIRARPDQLDALATELAAFANVAVVNAYSSASDVLYEANRLATERESPRAVAPQLLFGATVTFSVGENQWREHGFTYALGDEALSVRTLALPPSTELELELVPPAQTATLRLSGEVTERRVFGQPQRQSAPPGFTVRLFGEGLEAWQSAVRAAYQQRFGRELVAPHAPEKPDTSAVEAVRIARVKLVSPPESAAADPPSAVPNPKSEHEPATQAEAIGQPHPEPAESELPGDAHAPTTLVSVEQPPNDSASELPTEPAERGAERGSNPPPQASMDPPASTDEALSDALATRAEPMQERYEPAQPADTDEESSRPARVVASTKPPKRGSAGAMLAWLMVFSAVVVGLWIASRPPPNTSHQGATEEPRVDATAASGATRVQALTSVTTSPHSPNGGPPQVAGVKSNEAPSAGAAQVASAPAMPPELEVDPAALPGHLGYLHVTSTLDTNVFVQGKLVGRTNTPLKTFCGRRFVRLGSAAGYWQSPGITFRIGCQKLNRLTLQAARSERP